MWLLFCLNNIRAILEKSLTSPEVITLLEICGEVRRNLKCVKSAVKWLDYVQYRVSPQELFAQVINVNSAVNSAECTNHKNIF